jgi:hypothetical protein
MNTRNKINRNINRIKTVKKYKKNQPYQIKGSIIHQNKEGWTILKIYGEPYERGFAHGYLLSSQLVKCKNVFSYFLKSNLKISLSTYMKVVRTIIKPIIKEKYSEFYKEMIGISRGAKKAGSNISIDFIVAWNSYLSLYSYFKDGSLIRCSSFIATGNASEKGDIVMSHNTHTDFVDGQTNNVILYMFPSKGNSFVMQTVAGYIASGTDWFITSSGIIGCESTISFINYKPIFGDPYFCRIRQSMQYGNTLDDYVNIMNTNNAGDYACTWLFGNINTNEIMQFEQGLNVVSVNKTNNGVFYAANGAMSEELRTTETNDTDFQDIKTSIGARNKRFDFLLNKEYYGKINIENSKKIISDHYDVYLKKNIENNRGICRHMEKNNSTNELFGSIDAKIVNTEMAKEMKFYARFGSACGRLFSKKEYFLKNKQNHMIELIEDFPNNDWIIVEN